MHKRMRCWLACSLLVGSAFGCGARSTSDPVAAPPTAAPPKQRSIPYRLVADSIGFAVAVERGLLEAGQDVRFTLSDKATGEPLQGATIEVSGPNAHKAVSDEAGVVLVPLRLEWLDQDAQITLSHPDAEVGMAYAGTIEFACEEGRPGVGPNVRVIGPREYADLATMSVGVDRIYALDGAVRPQDMDWLAIHLARLREAYKSVTGWSPPGLAILLSTSNASLVPQPDADGRMVWHLEAAEIELKERSTQFLAHEWTHAALLKYAPNSGAGSLDVRWVEDGLCELVAASVERELFPDVEPTTTASRRRELDDRSAEIPTRLSLVGGNDEEGLSMYGTMVATCDRGALYGYAYSYALWLLADLDAEELRGVLTRLETEPLLVVAADVAPPELSSLALDLACARAALAGARSCEAAQN